MKALIIGVIAIALGCCAPGSAAAQKWLGFGTVSTNRDVNGQLFPGVAGGVLVDLARSRLTVGGQADLLFSGGYFAGRAGPVAQLNLLRRPIRAFVISGFAWGEQAGPMVGAGVDVKTKGRVGLRIAVQDYFVRVEGFDCAFFGLDQAYCDANFHGGRSFVGHQPSVQVGIVWH